MSAPETAPAYYRRRWASLKNERNPWEGTWREVDDNVSPMRARFLLTDRSKAKSNGKIINSTPVSALATAAAGFMSGVTNPSSPWLRTAPADAKIAQTGPVREWTHAVDEILLNVLARSNVYDVLPEIYADLIAYGTAAMFVDEDAEQIVRAYHLPIGQFALVNSEQLQVNTVYRELGMTVAQMVNRWGRERLSVGAKGAFDSREFDRVFPVLHVVEPNADYLPGAFGPAGMRFKSAWLELTGDDTTLLSVGGYEEQPFMAPRWAIQSEDVYGISPGMRALGDCRALQDYEKDKAAWVDRTVAPPMLVPQTLANKRVSLIPGDKIVVPDGNTDKVRPALELNPQGLVAVEEIVRQLEQRIRRLLHADIFQLFTDDTRSDVTAYERQLQRQEQLLQIGPVTQRINNELLDLLVIRLYGVSWRRGLIPEPPDELKVKDGTGEWVGTQPVRVEYISIGAQAQKAIGIIALERNAEVVAKLAANTGRVDILDNYDTDRWVRHHVAATGVPPDVLVSEEKVAAIRAERAKREQAQAQVEQAQQVADVGQTLAASPVQGDNALGALLASYNTPTSLGAA